MKKIIDTAGHGFHMTFENGLTASVQWGAGNYCDNRLGASSIFVHNNNAESNTAEVAVIYNGELIDANQFVPEEKTGYDTVVGWLTPEDIVAFLCAVKNADIKEIKGA